MNKLLKYCQTGGQSEPIKTLKKESSFYDNYISPAVQKTATVFNMNVFNKSHENFIDNLENVTPSVNGTYQKGNHILGGEFSEKTNDNIYKQKDWLKKSRNSTVGDKKIPLSNISNFYGVENNNFKAGSLNEFKSDTDLVPIRSKNTSVYSAKNEINKGFFYDNEDLVLRDSLGKKINDNVKSGGKLIMYSPVTKNKIFLNGNPDYEANEINKFIKKNPQSKYIMLDNGRFYNHLSNKEGLSQKDFDVYNTGTFKAGESKNYNIVSSKKQTGGNIPKDATNVSKTRISPLEKQKINNNYLQSLVDKNKTYLSQGKKSEPYIQNLRKEAYEIEQANQRINSRQDKANLLGLALAPIPVLGEVYNAGNLIAQTTVDALQGEYADAALSVIPYGIGKIKKVPGVLNNAYKLNPFAKGNVLNKFDENSFLRQIDKPTYREGIESGFIKGKQDIYKAKPGEISLGKSFGDDAYYRKGKPYYPNQERYPYMYESNAGEQAFIPKLNGRTKGLTTENTSVRVSKSPIPIKEADVYKHNWLKGYEKQQQGGIPERYKNKGFDKVGVKKNSTRDGKKWMVLAKKGDDYKIVHGGDSSMKDYSQHKDKDRQKNFWNRMGTTNDKFSPRYWHKKFGTWQVGGEEQEDLSLINAEKGEVYKDDMGNIKKVSTNAPTHDDGILIDEKNNTSKKASYNNGGVILNDATSVLSATHENRESDDKSYGLMDEIIKIKPRELSEYANQLGLKLKNNKSISPSKGFELLRVAKMKKSNILLNKHVLHSFSDTFSKNSNKANLLQADGLIKDEELYDMMFDIQEAKKLNVNKQYGRI